MRKLTKQNKITRKGPVVLVIMDGVGIGKGDIGDAFFNARTPLLNELAKTCPYLTIKAHGKAVGLPSDDDMGNSEVGHNALGAGRIFSQGALLVNKAIESGTMFENETWKTLTEKPIKGESALHFLGLLSDGNVHSHIDQLTSMVERCAIDNVKKVRLHILLDGRDVPEISAEIYINQIEKTLKQLQDKGFDYKIASGGGRMITTMDRYEADWSIVKRGWEAHVIGRARNFKSAMEAIETFRKEDSSITDQYLPSFTIVDDNGPVGTINDGDSVIFFNFRGDRAIEISRAFEQENFPYFDREKFPKVLYAGMMEYDGDLHIPSRYLVNPPSIHETISEYIVHTGLKQFAVSETQKFGHVTYFWNGNRSGKFDESMEEYLEIPSDKLEFNQRPWMQAAQITDAVIEALNSNKFDFIRLNYPNGDMVGHTGDLEAAIIAAETVDLCLRRLLPVIKHHGAIAVITADHGNLEEMYEVNKKTGAPEVDKETGHFKNKTSHTLNPVPVTIYDPDYKGEYELSKVENPGLANIAATLLMMLDLEVPENYEPSLIKWK